MNPFGFVGLGRILRQQIAMIAHLWDSVFPGCVFLSVSHMRHFLTKGRQPRGGKGNPL